MYIILKARGTNVGDKLIFESCKNIIEKIDSEAKFTDVFHDFSIGDNLDQINASRAIIIPHLAIRHQMWPQIYRLVDDLNKIKVPIVSIGTGAKELKTKYKVIGGKSMFDMNAPMIRFSPSIQQLFEHIQKPISVRDKYTQRVLNTNGFNLEDVILTGDPAWYDFKNMEKDWIIPEKINRVAFTTPHAPWMMDQAKTVINAIRELWPNAEWFCCLHSGKNLDDNTVAEFAESVGFETKIMETVKELEFYTTCDIHIGYRLHAHIYNLRNNIPSWLIYEDARGAAFDETFNSKIGFFGLQKPVNPLKQFLTKKGRLRHYQVKHSLALEIKKYFQNDPFEEYRHPLKLKGFFKRKWEESMKPYLQKSLKLAV